MSSFSNLSLNNTFASLPDDFYSRVRPTPCDEPYMVHFNTELAQQLGIGNDDAHSKEGLAYLSGNALFTNAEPIAMLYSGHQFGQYNPQLGDGRAILVCEIQNGEPETWDLQLKGAGTTPYSRGGDGRAVLRSTIREYLCSEAMYGLGIPTTRALAIVGSDMNIYREEIESAAILTRVAQSHVRFGSFEVFRWRDQFDLLEQLADYVIEYHFPHLVNDENKYAKMLAEVSEKTASLIAQWQAVGFTHGVMNTDNMSILGLTLDYGPYGFLDSFNPNFIPNHSDPMGRYAFEKQPAIGLWNCERLAEALQPLMTDDDAREALQTYSQTFGEQMGKLFLAKLGLRENRDSDKELLSELFAILAFNKVDYTNFFRALGDFSTDDATNSEELLSLFTDRLACEKWLAQYKTRILSEGTTDANNSDDARRTRMNACNPKYILRNYMAQVAIEKAQREKDYSEIETLMTILRNPFDEWPEYNDYTKPPPEWGQRLVISCSS